MGRDLQAVRLRLVKDTVTRTYNVPVSARVIVVLGEVCAACLARVSTVVSD